MATVIILKSVLLVHPRRQRKLMKRTTECIARLFLCARCQVAVTICSCCDRGNVYCPDCSKIARRDSMQKANRRYQHTEKGRQRHVARQKRYRCKKPTVTHQGRQEILQSDVLLNVIKWIPPPEKVINVCHFCGKICSWFVQSDCLRKSRSKISRL